MHFLLLNVQELRNRSCTKRHHMLHILFTLQELRRHCRSRAKGFFCVATHPLPSPSSCTSATAVAATPTKTFSSKPLNSTASGASGPETPSWRKPTEGSLHTVVASTRAAPPRSSTSKHSVSTCTPRLISRPRQSLCAFESALGRAPPAAVASRTSFALYALLFALPKTGGSRVATAATAYCQPRQCKPFSDEPKELEPGNLSLSLDNEPSLLCKHGILNYRNMLFTFVRCQCPFLRF